MITSSYPLAHTNKIFKALNLLKVEDIFKFKQIVLYHKLIHDTLPSNLSKLFSIASLNSSTNRRNNRNKYLIEISTNLKSTEHCVKYSLPRLINCLSIDYITLFSVSNILTFRNKLKKVIINLYDDSDCSDVNCYCCNRRLFYPSYISNTIKLMSIFGYI